MNDFERKLREQPFRVPPPAWRATILGSADRIGAFRNQSWTTWFWPSPLAWGALAALWLLFAVIQLGDRPAPPAARLAAGAVPETHAAPTLLGFHSARDSHHVFDLPN